MSLPDPSSPAPAMRAAKTPVGSGAVAGLGLVLALLTVLVGAAALRDAFVYGGALAGTPLLGLLARALDGVRTAAWMVPLALGLILLGLWVLSVALRPRPRTAVALDSETGVFLRPRDLARLAEDAAEQVDGVLDVDASATTRKVTVTVSGTGGDDVAERVRAAVTERLAPLHAAPAVRVRGDGDAR